MREYNRQLYHLGVPGDIRDRLVRSSLRAEALREAGVLLAVFGPVSTAEIFRSFSLRTTIVIWVFSAVLLLLGVEWDVSLQRERRKLVVERIAMRELLPILPAVLLGLTIAIVGYWDMRKISQFLAEHPDTASPNAPTTSGDPQARLPR